MLADVLMQVAGMEQNFWDESYRPRPSAAGQCIRALVYKHLGFPPQPIEDRFAVVFDDGNWHEELTLEWIAKTSWKVTDRQMEVVCGTVAGRHIKGHIDGILEDTEGKQRLWEHKSANHFSFARYETIIEDWQAAKAHPILDGDVPDLPDSPQLDDDDSYMIQVQLYLCSPELTALGITEALMLVKNKNTGRYVEFIIPRRPEIAIAAIAKLQRVEELAAANLIPDRPYNRETAWNCGYCRYENHCYDGYESEVACVGINDPAVVKSVGNYQKAVADATSAENRKKQAKLEIVRELDRLKAKEGVLPDGGKIKWASHVRKGYEVATTTYWQLSVPRTKSVKPVDKPDNTK